jgi:hypothetical protein
LGHDFLVDLFDVLLAEHGAVGVSLVGTAMLGKIVGAGEGLVAKVTDVRAFGGVGTDVSRNVISSRIRRNERMCQKTYLLRCSNLLKRRPHMGMGQEWDFCG